MGKGRSLGVTSQLDRLIAASSGYIFGIKRPSKRVEIGRVLQRGLSSGSAAKSELNLIPRPDTEVTDCLFQI